MASRREIRLYNTSYQLQRVFDTWRVLTFTKKVNGWGFHAIDFDDQRQTLAQQFGLDYFIEIWREDPAAGIAPYKEYEGFHRTPQRQLTETGLRIFTSYGRTYTDLLARRAVLYRAGSAGAEKSGPGETVMNYYVWENAGNIATTAAGRLADGVTTGLAIAGSGSGGGPWSGKKAFQNLLDVLVDISNSTGVDFQVVRTGTGPTFEFRTYYPQLGLNRAQGSLFPAVFGVPLANMQAPSYTLSRTEEITAVVVLGQGQDAQRAFLELTSATDLAASPWNRIEKTHDARNESTTAALQNEGLSQLAELGKKESFTFQVLQQSSLVYGRDYDLGDIVTATYGEISRNKKILEVSVSTGEGQESINFVFGDVL